MSAESSTALLPTPDFGGRDPFGSLVRQNFDPGFSDQAGPMEHPFGDGFLAALPDTVSREHTAMATPAPVTITATDEKGNTTEVETGSPD